MSYAPLESNLREAVSAVLKMKKENPRYPFGFCVQCISKNYRLDYSFLMSECGKRKKRNIPVKNKLYNGRLPYWLKDSLDKGEEE